jgi:hypothetical protein
MIDLEELLRGVAPLSSGNFVKQLKNRLKEEGVEVADKSGAKYFAACSGGPTIMLLSHESTDHGFWGVHADIVERCSEKLHEPTVWGAVLLDGSATRGFWIPGPRIKLAADSFSAVNQQHLFHKNRLIAKESLCPYFIGIHDFLGKTGLRSGTTKIEI